MSKVMNKAELVEVIAKNTKLSKADAERALIAMINAIKSSLKKDVDVSLKGFGTFRISKRSARKGRNPRTGATIQIAASKVPVFRAGSQFKEEVRK